MRSYVVKILACFMLLFVHTTATGKFMQATFRTVTGVGIEPIGTPTTLSSLLRCIFSCRTKYRSCYSVIYSTDTGLCTYGSFLTTATSGLKPSGPHERMMSMGPVCNTSRGFSVGTYADIAACFYVKNGKFIESQASSICQSDDGQLYTIKIEEKRQILIPSMTGLTFIGLNDTAQEDTFLWSDGTVMTSTQRQFFAPGEPSAKGRNGPDGEDCVELQSHFNFLYNDCHCTTPMQFACEIPDPYL